MILTVPDPSLVLLVGPSGCGKSTFARRHFRPTEVLSSDFFRGMVCDDEAEQASSRDAFDLLHAAAAKRLAWRRLTAVDATSVQAGRRRALLDLARQYHYLSVAVVFNLPEELCQANNRSRPGRQVDPGVVRLHLEQLRESLPALTEEGFRSVYVLSSPEEVASAAVERRPLPADRHEERGPFDVIGDVHGCLEELLALLRKLGYTVGDCTEPDGRPGYAVRPPGGRRAVFVGDLVDRGPDTPGVLRLVMGMAGAGTALCVIGNHDDKLLRKLKGHDVRPTHGLTETLRQLDAEPTGFKDRVLHFLDNLPDHYLLDGGRLVVAHAGLREELQGRTSRRVRSFALFGQTTGETDEAGLPVRLNWAADYRGRAQVVYGHTPVAEPGWLNRTINIDTGCVFGGRLTALRYPEMELAWVPAARVWCPPHRPFLPPTPPLGLA